VRSYRIGECEVSVEVAVDKRERAIADYAYWLAREDRARQAWAAAGRQRRTREGREAWAELENARYHVNGASNVCAFDAGRSGLCEAAERAKRGCGNGC